MFHLGKHSNIAGLYVKGC